MSSTVAHWAISVLAVGVVAAVVLLAAAAAGVWWLRRWARRRLEDFIGKAAGYARRAAATTVSDSREPLRAVTVRGTSAADRVEPGLSRWPGG